MTVKFIIPLLDTERGKFEYDGELSDAAYFGMVQNRVMQTQRIMNEFAYAYKNGMAIGHDVRGIYDRQPNQDVEAKFIFSESEAVLFDANNNEIEIPDLYNYLRSGKKFILKVSINPLSMENDAESDIRAWMDESDKVLHDTALDQRTMLLSLPTRNFVIDTAVDGDDSKPIFQVFDCKILQVYKKQTNRYYFGMMVNEILEQ